MRMCRTLHEIERDAILLTLYRVKGNKSKCAKELGVALGTIKNRCRVYEAEEWIIPRPEQWNEDYLDRKRLEAEDMEQA